MKLAAKLTLAAALAAPMVAPTFARADGPNTGAINFSGGFDVSSAYYFRGYLQENAGFIFQPYLTMSTTFVKNDQMSLGAGINTWNSIHSEDTLSDGGGTGAWYENDINLTLPMTFGSFWITPVYTLYQYPNGAFETIQEVGVTVGYDDSKNPIIPNFAIKPYAGIFYEIDDANGTEDGYAELGIKPGYKFNVGGKDLELTFPIALGLSWDDFYLNSDGDNSVFGYLQAGVEASIALPVPEKYGAWSLVGGGYYQYLFADSAELANNDSEHVFWGRVGISFSY